MRVGTFVMTNLGDDGVWPALVLFEHPEAVLDLFVFSPSEQFLDRHVPKGNPTATGCWFDRDERPVRTEPVSRPPADVPDEFRSLWGNCDPAEWAKSFMLKFGKHRQLLDEETMLAWFASAMQSSGGVGQGTADDLAMALASAVDGHEDPTVRRRAEAALRLYVNEAGDATLEYVKKVLDSLRGV